MSRELALLVLFVLVLSFWANAAWFVTDPASYRFFPPFQAGLNANDNTLLGAEYLNIGRALAAGQGFSNPFGAATGPTAWMPPLYPFLLALLHLISGELAFVTLAVLLLKNATLVLTGWVVLLAARQRHDRLGPTVALAIYALWLVTHYWWFFQHTHDIWLLLLLCDLSLLCSWFWLPHRPNMPRHLVWGLLGGALFLTSPVAGLAWLVLAGVTALSTRRLRLTTVSLLIALACCGSWVVRNSVVFDRVMFIKSNFYFDLFQANYQSADGVYDEGFFAGHPVWTTGKDASSLYRTLGEVEFNERYGALFLERFKQRPGDYFAKVRNRLLAATLVYKPYRSYEGARPVVRSLVHAAPFVGLVAFVALRRFKLSRPMTAGVVFYTAYLLPYVGVAFYTRYLLPLTPVLVMFVFWGADSVAARIRPDSS